MAQLSRWISRRCLCWKRLKFSRAYFRAPETPLSIVAGRPFTSGPLNNHINCNLHSSNSKLDPRASSSVEFSLAHPIAGYRSRCLSEVKIEYMPANFSCRAWDWKAVRSEGISASVIIASGGVSGRDTVIEGGWCWSWDGDGDVSLCGCASAINVEATPNCPSRNKCIAMARLIRAVCEAIGS